MILQIYEKNQIQQPTIEKKSHPQMRISDSNKSQQTHNKQYRQQMTIRLKVAFFYCRTPYNTAPDAPIQWQMGT